MSNYPLLGPQRSAELRASNHADAVKSQECHAYAGREYHYCGRRSGRLFPLAPDIEISTTIQEGGDGIPLWAWRCIILAVTVLLVYLIMTSR